MLTETTTRDEFLEHLRSTTRNIAVLRHEMRVAAMSEEEWAVHRDKLIAETQMPEFKQAVDRMIGELEEQGVRFR